MSYKRFSHGLLGTTFHQNNQFIATRVQKQVPLFDVDLNEMDDIRRHHSEALWRLIFGDGPAVIIRNEWDQKRTFQAYKNEVEQGDGIPRDFVPFAPNIIGDSDDLTLHMGDFYWDGYWMGSPHISSLEAHMKNSIKEIENIRKIYQVANDPSKPIPALKSITTILQELAGKTQICVLGIHAWKYLYTPEEDGNLKRPVGGGTDSMSTCSRVKLFWTFRFSIMSDFQKLYSEVEGRRQGPFDGSESACPLKIANGAPQEVLFPLFAFQIEKGKIKSVASTESNLMKLQQWGTGGTFSAKTFQEAYKEIGSFAKDKLDKIYIKRLRNVLLGK